MADVKGNLSGVSQASGGNSKVDVHITQFGRNIIRNVLGSIFKGK
jgi:hypothetical protein